MTSSPISVTTTIVDDDYAEPIGPNDILLYINDSDTPMILHVDEDTNVREYLDTIGTFLCPLGVSQQNLATVYRKHYLDAHITRQKR